MKDMWGIGLLYEIQCTEFNVCICMLGIMCVLCVGESVCACVCMYFSDLR